MVGSKTNKLHEVVQIHAKHKGVDKTDVLISCIFRLYISFKRSL